MLILLVSAVFLVSACGKDGDAGPAGTAGEKGDKGDPGTPGTNGIIYSDWLDVMYEADTIHTSGGTVDTIGFYAIIPAPKLTAQLLATADVKVYINLNDASDPVIAPLPYVEQSGLVIRFVASAGELTIDANVDPSTYTANGKKYLQHRYMIVPGGTAARHAGSDVNWSDYSAVKAYLGLKD